MPWPRSDDLVLKVAEFCGVLVALEYGKEHRQNGTGE